MTRGLLDTSVIIALPDLGPDDPLPDEPMISAVTLAELSVGPLVATSEPERVARLVRLQQTEADFDPIAFDAQAARAFGGVAASLRRANRRASARSYDAMIAATAIAHGLELYTCNPDDFAHVEGLTVVALTQPATAGRGLA